MAGCAKYTLYMAFNNEKYFIGYTHDPSLDATFLSGNGYHSFYLLSMPMSAGKAIPLYKRISPHGIFKEAPLKGTITEVLKRKRKELRSAARYLGIPAEAVSITGPVELEFKQCPGEGQKRAVEEAIRGRILFPEEIERLLFRAKLRLTAETEDILQLLCLENKCIRLPGIKEVGRKKYLCCRCGQNERIVPVACASCGDTCFHCETCLSMGESRFCQVIYAVPGNADSCRLPIKDIKPKMFVTLSPAQENASNALRQFVLQPEQKERLVWAACGAGKTEVTFRAIAEALSRNQKVLFAIPRKDTVQEIVVRIRRAFPQVPVACLHGTSKEKYSEACVVVATTHQVIRFYSAFDLVILDEIDAYPYSVSPMLESCILRAKTRNGKIIFMSATPSAEMIARYRRKELACVWIPARHHGYSLPEPKIVVDRRLPLLDLGNTIPESIIEIIHETLEGDGAQLFVFVPTIESGFKVYESLERVLRLPPFNNFTGNWVQFCHSRDENREKKLAAFRKGLFPILVTTTVCERGLTLPRVNVLVLFADRERIFDASALIQMAGRSGRTVEYPTGRVWFAGSKCTREMKTACDRIKMLNLQAREMGYLDNERAYDLKRKGGF